MAVFKNLYSKRNKKPVDVFTYDKIPEGLKIQIFYIWQNFFNQLSKDISFITWGKIDRILCEEHKRDYLALSGNLILTNEEGVRWYFRRNEDIEEGLDVIIVVLAYIEQEYKVSIKTPKKLEYTFEDVIQDINTRFLEHGVGYEFRDGTIIRMDNTLLHQEIIIPSLHFLSPPEFQNANNEYLSAHEHFRNGHTKDCLNNCLKALESTLKIICDLNSWTYNPKDTANNLIKVVIDNKLIPDFLLQHFSSIRSSLESGVPTFRNRLSGHGQGPQKIEVPMHYASYMLYLTGTTINFLVSCQQELKP